MIPKNSMWCVILKDQMINVSVKNFNLNQIKNVSNVMKLVLHVMEKLKIIVQAKIAPKDTKK